MSKAYLSGPMTGKENFNRPLFERAATWLRDHGYDVVSPHELNAHHEAALSGDELWRACMRNDIKALMDCAVMWVLPGWETSRGASLEFLLPLRWECRLWSFEHER